MQNNYSNEFFIEKTKDAYFIKNGYGHIVKKVRNYDEALSILKTKNVNEQFKTNYYGNNYANQALDLRFNNNPNIEYLLNEIAKLTAYVQAHYAGSIHPLQQTYMNNFSHHSTMRNPSAPQFNDELATILAEIRNLKKPESGFAQAQMNPNSIKESDQEASIPSFEQIDRELLERITQLEQSNDNFKQQKIAAIDTSMSQLKEKIHAISSKLQQLETNEFDVKLFEDNLLKSVGNLINKEFEQIDQKLHLFDSQIRQIAESNNTNELESKIIEHLQSFVVSQMKNVHATLKNVESRLDDVTQIDPQAIEQVILVQLKETINKQMHNVNDNLGDAVEKLESKISHNSLEIAQIEHKILTSVMELIDAKEKKHAKTLTTAEFKKINHQYLAKYERLAETFATESVKINDLLSAQAIENQQNAKIIAQLRSELQKVTSARNAEKSIDTKTRQPRQVKKAPAKLKSPTKVLDASIEEMNDFEKVFSEVQNNGTLTEYLNILEDI